MKISIKQRAIVFASYNRNDIIADYVVYYLKELRKISNKIVFVCDNDLPEKETRKVTDYTIQVICKRHGSYDFGSYRLGFLWLCDNQYLNNIEELCFINDSCYGPIYPLEDVFKAMDYRTCDFWGLTDSHEKEYHIQSFFLAFRKNTFESLEFNNFVMGFKKEASFEDYVNNYELNFTKVLKDAGFKSDTFISINRNSVLDKYFFIGNGNLTCTPLFLLENGMPLIKVKALSGTFGHDLKDNIFKVKQRIKQLNPELFQLIERDLQQKGIVYEDWQLSPQEIVENTRVVSFDVFDTLLRRPFAKPTDLFLLIEQQYKIKDFCKKRIQAERRARRHHRNQADITIDQIYQELGHKHTFLKEKELELERKLLKPKTDGMRLYEEAVRQGKTIIAISDMYLPQPFIEQVLKDNGFTQISQVFVSNQENCCKGDGKLFKVAMKKLNIREEELVHIGDNLEADKTAPTKLGIRAFHRPKDIDLFFSDLSKTKYKCLYNNVQGLDVSTLVSLFSQHREKDKSAYTELGYHLGGALAVGYCMHIHNLAKQRGNDGILFVSRDGYTLQKVYEKMYPNDIPSYYVYASRKIILRNSAVHNSKKNQNIVYEVFSKECLNGISVTEENIEQYRKEIQEWAENNANNYNKYINTLHITGNKLMSVDMTTKEYTSLYMLRQVFGERLDCGMFSYSYGDACNYPVFSFAKNNWRDEDMPLIVMQEELLTAPESSALSVDENGVFTFAKEDRIEKYRIEKYKEIMEGILEFTDDYKRCLAGYNIPFTFHFWQILFSHYTHIHHYGDDMLMKHVYHNDVGQQNYDTLYSFCIEKKPSNTIDVGRLYHKYKKHLKTIRIFIYCSIIETIALIITLILLLL